MGQVELLRALLRQEFGIEDDAGLMAAMEELPPLDLGIFCAPLENEDGHGIFGRAKDDGGARLCAG